MGSKCLKKKFEPNQPLRNSLRTYKELKATHDLRYFPYGKSDAAIVRNEEKFKDVCNSHLFPNLKSKKIKGIGNSMTSLNIAKNDLLFMSDSLNFVEHPSVSKESQENIGNNLEFFTSSQKSQQIWPCFETVGLQVSLKYECFQINCNSNCVFLNFNCAIPNKGSEELAQTYSSCLPLVQNYFKDVKPVVPNIPMTSNLEYSPEFDSLPDYSGMTETEISLLQRMACGCKSLSWDEFEKMYLIEEKSEIKDSENDSKSFFTEDPLASSSSTNKNLDLNTLIFKHRIFHRHKNTSANYSPIFSENKKPNSFDSDNKGHFRKSIEEDPLNMPDDPNEEMIDSTDTVQYVGFDDENINLEKKTNEEILGVSKSEIEYIRDQLNQFVVERVATNLEELLTLARDEPEPQPSVSSVLRDPLSLSGNEDIELSATTISEMEFSATSDDNQNTELAEALSTDGNINVISGLNGCEATDATNLERDSGSMNEATHFLLPANAPTSLPRTSTKPSSFQICLDANNGSSFSDIEIIGESKLDPVTRNVSKCTSSTNRKSSVPFTKFPSSKPGPKLETMLSSGSIFIDPFLGSPSQRDAASSRQRISFTEPPSASHRDYSLPIIQFVRSDNDSQDSFNLVRRPEPADGQRSGEEPVANSPRSNCAAASSSPNDDQNGEKRLEANSGSNAASECETGGDAVMLDLETDVLAFLEEINDFADNVEESEDPLKKVTFFPIPLSSGEEASVSDAPTRDNKETCVSDLRTQDIQKESGARTQDNEEQSVSNPRTQDMEEGGSDPGTQNKGGVSDPGTQGTEESGVALDNSSLQAGSEVSKLDELKVLKTFEKFNSLTTKD